MSETKSQTKYCNVCARGHAAGPSETKMIHGWCLWLLLATIFLLTISACVASVVTPTTTHATTTFHVAPMQGYTNYPLRCLYSQLNPTVTLWTEMEKLSDLQDPAGWPRRFGSRNSHFKKKNKRKNPLVLQIGTADPGQIRSILPPLLQAYASVVDEVNLNCGCPSIQAGGASTYGASLMKQPILTANLVEALRDAAKPLDMRVSFKCRIGVWETPDEAVSTTTMYQRLHQYLRLAQAAGLEHVVLHARPAVLQGFNPAQNRCIPALDYDLVQGIAQDFSSSLQVTLNGGIGSLNDWRQWRNDEKNDIAGYMAGRWLLQRPLDLAYIGDNTQDGFSKTNIPLAVEHYVQQILSEYDTSTTLLHEICLPLYLVTEQLAHDYESRWVDNDDDHDVCLTKSVIEDLYGIVSNALLELHQRVGKKPKPFSDRMHFKKLSNAFKGLVGTKVVNKWKRNRAEL